MAERIGPSVAARLRARARKYGNAGAVENARRSAEAEAQALEALDRMAGRVPPPAPG
jgi:hypothetical protein